TKRIRSHIERQAPSGRITTGRYLHRDRWANRYSRRASDSDQKNESCDPANFGEAKHVDPFAADHELSQKRCPWLFLRAPTQTSPRIPSGQENASFSERITGIFFGMRLDPSPL